MPTKRKVIPIKLLQCRVHLVENAEILITAEIQESKLPHVVSTFPIVVSLNWKICVRLIFCLLLAMSITVASVYFKRRDFFLSWFFILVYITCGASSVKASKTPNMLISYNWEMWRRYRWMFCGSWRLLYSICRITRTILKIWKHLEVKKVIKIITYLVYTCKDSTCFRV